jgi:DNA-binding LacI/PurR family transcriptional regulator
MESGASERTQRPTLAAVATLAGVSASTASLAFSGAGPVSAATKERVLAAARALDYGGPDPRAQSLRRGRSGVVGVVMADRLRDAFRDPVNIAMLDGIADELGSASLGLLLMTEPGQGGTDLSTAPMDAVVLVGCSTKVEESVVVFRQRGIPVVVIEAEAMPDVLSIDLDNAEATARAARHLASLGHERVAIVTLPLEPSHERGPLTPEREAVSTAYTAKQRIRGVRAVFPQAGGFVASGSLVEEGMIAGREILALAPRPTAVIAQSDLLALGVIRAAEEAGVRVPEELSVVGFDGIRIDGAESRNLTTLVQPSVEKGRAAGRAIIELLAGGHPDSVSFTSTLRIGSTTGPVPY